MLPDQSITESCLRCKAPMQLGETFCSACGANRDVELEAEAFAGPALRSARNWILAIGILYMVSAVLILGIAGVDFGSELGMQILGTNAALLVIHIGLFFWAKKAPFAAAVVALCLFITVHLINAIIDPTSIYQGIIIKILFLVVLIKAVSAGQQANRIRAQAVPTARVQ